MWPGYSSSGHQKRCVCVCVCYIWFHFDLPMVTPCDHWQCGFIHFGYLSDNFVIKAVSAF